MEKIVSIDLINSVITGCYPEYNNTERNFCFRKLYDIYGSTKYDSDKENDIIRNIGQKLEEIKPKKHLRDRVTIPDVITEKGTDFCYIGDCNIPDEEFEVVFSDGKLKDRVFLIHGIWVRKNCSLYETKVMQEVYYKIPVEELTEIKIAGKRS